MRHSSVLAVLIAAIALVPLTASATTSRSDAGTAWDRISGPTQPGVELGLARTKDGVLHAISNRGVSGTSISETRVAPSGRTIGTSTVATGWDGNGGLALVTMPNGTLRLFAAGATHAGSSAFGINTFTAPAGGGSWQLQNGVFWGGAVANSAAYIGAALTRDGQPVTAWRGLAGEGLPPQTSSAYQAGMTASQLATDAGNGAVVLSGVTNAGKGGVYVQQVLPDQGARVVLPLPVGINDWNSSLSARTGAAGVYVAYADGKGARLYRYGGRSLTLRSGSFVSAAVCAPAGRLWVAWGDKVDGVFVTRSNMGVSGFEPVQRLKLAQNTTDGLTYLQCEGSIGPVDLFADVFIGAAGGFWHTHLLPHFSLLERARRSQVTLIARAAGDPVAGASIKVAGRRVLTGVNGQTTLVLRRRRDATGAGNLDSDRKTNRAARSRRADEQGHRRKDVRQREDGRGQSQPRVPQARHLGPHATRPCTRRGPAAAELTRAPPEE